MKEGGSPAFLNISFVIHAVIILHKGGVYEELWLVNDEELRDHWKAGNFLYLLCHRSGKNHIMSSNRIKDRKHLTMAFFLCLIFFLSHLSQGCWEQITDLIEVKTRKSFYLWENCNTFLLSTVLFLCHALTSPTQTHAEYWRLERVLHLLDSTMVVRLENMWGV